MRVHTCRRNFLALMQPERETEIEKEREEPRERRKEREREREREIGDVKCRVHTSRRNCSLRFSREDLRRDLRLRTRLPLQKKTIIPDAR